LKLEQFPKIPVLSAQNAPRNEHLGKLRATRRESNDAIASLEFLLRLLQNSL